MNIPQDRGLYEPSLTELEGRHFLTLQADHSAFVTKGVEGINFEPIREWRFDDRTLLVSHNTQQHWITAGDGLFLIYTRKRGGQRPRLQTSRAPLYRSSVIGHRSSVIGHRSSVIGHRSSVSGGTPREFAVCHQK